MTGEKADLNEPYLEVEPHPNIKNKIVILRSFRFRNNLINYNFLKNFNDLLFVGLESEFEDLKQSIPNLQFYHCKDFYEMSQIIKSAKSNRNFTVTVLTENRLMNKKINGINISLNDEKAFKKADVIIDFTIPKCTFEVLKIASKLKKKVVIGTTGFTKKEENLIKNYSKKIPILKAGNMSLGINLLMYLTEITSASLGNNYLSKVFEVHHRHKKDHPSGTALMLGKGIAVGKNKDFYKLMGKKYLNKKFFPYGKKINFNSIRKGEIIGEHEVKFSSGKEIITLNHEAFDRALYSEGALTAAKWLSKKKTGFYSMRNLLNF